MASRLINQVFLITGATGGIGQAVTKRFATEGATLVLTDSQVAICLPDTVKMAQNASASAGFSSIKHLGIHGDISSADVVEEIFAEALKQQGRIDGLVNLAGIQHETPSHQLTPALYQMVTDVTLNGSLFSAQAAIRHFLSRSGGGVIVNCSSVHEMIPKPGFVSYSMAKAAISAMTRTLALEYAGNGIRVNAVGPGAVDTPINDSWRKDLEKRALVESHIPLGRVGDPDEIAGIFAFLASSEAAYITGQTLFACGGLTLYNEFKTNWSS